MDDNELVLDLLAFYKDSGVDLYRVLDNPLFMKLPLRARVQVIQTQADALQRSMPSNLPSAEARQLALRTLLKTLGGAAAGSAVGATLQGAFPHVGKVPLAIGALTGALAGGVSSAMSALKTSGERDALRAQLDVTAKNPTPANALGVLSIRGIHSANKAYLEDLTAAVDSALSTNTSQATIERLSRTHLSRTLP